LLRLVLTSFFLKYYLQNLTAANQRKKLQALVEAEWTKYREAISNDEPFEQVKVIYLQIKGWQTSLSN